VGLTYLDTLVVASYEKTKIFSRAALNSALPCALGRSSGGNWDLDTASENFSENVGSISLYRRFGFREVGRHSRLKVLENKGMKYHSLSRTVVVYMSSNSFSLHLNTMGHPADKWDHPSGKH
tara:strand:+ start:247 stop:612 length:366 start_codon:yes stop_codon:yes gene_type:complete